MISRIRIVAIAVLLTGGTLTILAQVSTPTPALLREGFVTVPGARIFNTDTGGDGVPVVFLHAATGHTSAWQYQTPAFTAAGYRVVAYDRRGWGRTLVDASGPAGTAADDLEGLLDALKLDRVHLVATAGGGFVAFDFALSFPDRLRSLVVADSIGGVRDKEILDLETRIRPPQFDALPPEVRELSPGYRAANPEGTRKWVDIEKQSRLTQPQASTLELAYATPMRNQLTLALFEQIRTPTLVLTGGADMTAPPALMKILVSHIRNAEFFVVPNAGHSVYWEEPEVFNRSVLDFIRKH
jgi:pimeloyl-ACP methyl ester carboxylesterase